MKKFIASKVKLTYINRVKKADRIKVNNSRTAYEAFLENFEHDQLDHRERSFAVFLNNDNELLNIEELSVGGMDGTIIDGRILFQQALLLNASAIILSHNHPSGKLQASNADVTITKDLSILGERLRIQLLDHLIITSESYLSMKDEGLF